MNKFVVNTLILLVLSIFSSISQATLLTNLTQAELDSKDYSNAEDQLTSNLEGANYVSYKGYDWAWVSSLNLESSVGNILYAPEVQENWQFADAGLLTILKELTIVNFTDDNGNLIQAMEYFNSDHTQLESTSEHDFSVGFVSSEWTVPGTFFWDIYSQQETFYVRESSVAPTPVKPIPEPLSILIFATALFILQTNLRKKSI